jgi:hypothetical protein
MACEVTPERFHELTGMKLSVVYDYLNNRSPVMWDPRDVRELTRATKLLTMAAPNASGQGARPRTLPNPNYRKAKGSVLEAGGAGAVDVVAVEGPGVGGVPAPTAEHVEGNPAFGMVGAEGMAQALEVGTRKAMALHG